MVQVTDVFMDLKFQHPRTRGLVMGFQKMKISLFEEIIVNFIFNPIESRKFLHSVAALTNRHIHIVDHLSY